jgi:CDP-glucose 4,6-dehydratase
MTEPRLDPQFWSGKRVLVTGHTGFKGAWLCHWLLRLGAQVSGFSLPPASNPNLFHLLNLEERMASHLGDLRYIDQVEHIIRSVQPDIVLHLAAQALVRPSYEDPLSTFESNVMGTTHLLEALRISHLPEVCLVATTDKVYRNLEQGKPFREDDPLGGHDPYSASKAATEIVVSSYRQSFFEHTKSKLISVRAGNAIGGGDWSVDRIIPDAIRAWTQGDVLAVRRPNAIRPWQHVLEPLFGYLFLCQSANQTRHACYNIGPSVHDKTTVGELIQNAQAMFGCGEVEFSANENGPHEAGLLQLDVGRIDEEFGLQPQWTSQQALRYTIGWYKAFYDNEDAINLCDQDIDAFLGAT